MALVVVSIPAYNEKDTIGKVILEIKRVMSSIGYNFKILVVDDSSIDGTAKVARESGAVVFSHPINYGLAETFKTEMKKAIEMKADIIVHMDADGYYARKCLAFSAS